LVEEIVLWARENEKSNAELTVGWIVPGELVDDATAKTDCGESQLRHKLHNTPLKCL
jgi:hypothetical protein